MINKKNYPFVLSADEVLGKETQVVLATLSHLMAAKMEEPVSQVKDWVNGRISIVVARLYSRMLYGSWVPSTLRTPEPD